MTSSASLLSAAAASIAAILTAINLFLSGRREHNRWARDVLVDVFVTFLNAGFASTGEGSKLAGLRRSDASPRDMAAIRGNIRDAHREETAMLTKMRLLTAPSVVEAAMALHVASHSYVTFVENAQAVPDLDAQQAARDEVWAARRAFLATAKGALGLKRDVSAVTHDTMAPSRR